MIKNLSLLLVFILSGCSVFSQHLFLTNPDSLAGFFESNKVVISVDGGVHQQGNAITNSFINKFINGGFIDNDLKDKQELTTEENLLSGGFNFGINAMLAPDSLFGSNRFGWVIGLSHVDDLSARFTNDVFNTVFYGNKSYAGKTADLSNTGVRYQRFQQLNIGFFEKSTLSYVSLGVVRGNLFADLTLADAGLFTEETGEYVELSADGRFHISDTANTSGLVMNGIGGVVNFELNFPVHFNNRPEKPSYLRFGGHNVGFTRWNKETVNYELDSTYHYEGFLIDDLAEFGNLDQSAENVVDSLVPDASYESYIMTTPGWFYLSWFSPLGKSLFYELEVRTKIYAFHLPELKARLIYKPGERWLAGVNATYGGYGGYESSSAFRGGIFLSAFIGNHFMVHAESDHITGWFMENAKGRSAYLKLSYFF